MVRDFCLEVGLAVVTSIGHRQCTSGSDSTGGCQIHGAVEWTDEFPSFSSRAFGDSAGPLIDPAFSCISLFLLQKCAEQQGAISEERRYLEETARKKVSLWN